MHAMKELWTGFDEDWLGCVFLLLLLACVPVALAGHVKVGIVMLLVAEFGLLEVVQ